MSKPDLSTSIPGDLGRLLNTIDETPIRTRGRLPVREGLAAGKRLPLADLISQVLRPAVARFALTFVIHDWGIPQAIDFVNELASLLDDQDGLWLVPGQQRGSRESALPHGIELDLNDMTDKQLYRTLVGDLVFFAGQGANINQIATWQHRARVTVVDMSGPLCGQIVAVAQSKGIEIYQRGTNRILIES